MEEIDTDCTDSPICPHCGYEHRDWTEILPAHPADGGKVEFECDDCGKPIDATYTISIIWSTEKGE